VRSLFGIRTVLATVALAGLVCPAVAQDLAAGSRSITVTGQGEAAGAPDQATVTAGVQTLAATAEESAQQNQAVIARIMQALWDEDVEEQDIQTSDYSIWPQQQQDPGRSGEVTIVGYRVSNTVRITVDDIDRLGDILGAVTKAGANTIHGISFGVADSAALEAQAREAAMKDARNKAASLAELAGVELGSVLRITMSSSGGYPMPVTSRYASMAAMESGPDISAGQLSVSVQVEVSYEIR